MKIGILTYFGAHNYGAFLQAYALREVIGRELGGEAELINYRTATEVKNYRCERCPLFHPRHYIRNIRRYRYSHLQFKTFEKSIKKYQTLSKEKLVSDSAEAFSAMVRGKYDLIIAGSDEIWKTDGFRPFPNAYWLPDVSGRKAAFAVSSRNPVGSMNEAKKTLISSYFACR